VRGPNGGLNLSLSGHAISDINPATEATKIPQCSRLHRGPLAKIGNWRDGHLTPPDLPHCRDIAWRERHRGELSKAQARRRLSVPSREGVPQHQYA
jgi:hypothetical protein